MKIIFRYTEMHSEKVHANKLGGVFLPTGVRVLTRRVQPFENSWKCRETDCQESVVYFCNSRGTESLCCEEHSKDFIHRHQDIDDRQWFCRRLMKEKRSASEMRNILVWKIPIQGRSRFGGLEWLWYPSVDNNSNSVMYRIYKSKDEYSNDLPLNVRWEKITIEEATNLLGQMLYERRLGYIPRIVGFASDSPFDRPDLTLGYSVRSHRGSSTDREAYFFNYTQKCAPDKIERSWTGDVISFHPQEGGRCNAGNFVRRQRLSAEENDNSINL